MQQRWLVIIQTASRLCVWGEYDDVLVSAISGRCFGLNDASAHRRFLLSNEYCTVICGDSGFIVPVPVLSSTIYLYNYSVQRCFCFRMNTACLSAYNYVYVPEHLHYIFSQDLVWLVGLIVCWQRSKYDFVIFRPRRLYFRCGDYISAPAAFDMLLFRPGGSVSPIDSPEGEFLAGWSISRHRQSNTRNHGKMPSVHLHSTSGRTFASNIVKVVLHELQTCIFHQFRLFVQSLLSLLSPLTTQSFQLG